MISVSVIKILKLSGLRLKIQKQKIFFVPVPTDLLALIFQDFMIIFRGHSATTRFASRFC